MTHPDDPRTLEMDWDYQFHVNNKTNSWRDRLARRLRIIAQQIDGRTTLGIHITTSPAIGSRRTQDCIRHGLAAMKEAVASEVSAEAQEALFRRMQPYLFEDSDETHLIALAPEDVPHPADAHRNGHGR